MRATGAEWLPLWLVGRTIREATSPRPHLARLTDALDGRRIERVEVHGRLLVLVLDDGRCLTNNPLGRGRWRKLQRGDPGTPPDTWLRLDVGRYAVANLGGEVLVLLEAEHARRLADHADAGAGGDPEPGQ